MNHSDISKLRLHNQKISNTEFNSESEIIRWMGAMQAQDFSMAKWAIGSRILNPLEKNIEEAFNRGDFLRTHVLRPTWHFVLPGDIYWMLDLTASRIKNSSKARNKELELTEKIFTKSRKMLEKILSGGIFLTREELSQEYNNAGIKTNDNRLSHLLQEAETDGIICSGPLKGKKQTHAILSERAGAKKHFSKEEALAELAMRYFRSHGPATVHDFAWWSGLSAPDVRHAFELIKTQLVSEIIDSDTYWMAGQPADLKNTPDTFHLLPAYDEFLISYRDRKSSISAEVNRKAISDNGIFRPIIVENGNVSGIWKRTSKTDNIHFEADFFKPAGKASISSLKSATEKYKFFSGKPVIFKF